MHNTHMHAHTTCHHYTSSPSGCTQDQPELSSMLLLSESQLLSIIRTHRTILTQQQSCFNQITCYTTNTSQVERDLYITSLQQPAPSGPLCDLFVGCHSNAGMQCSEADNVRWQALTGLKIPFYDLRSN